MGLLAFVSCLSVYWSISFSNHIDTVHADLDREYQETRTVYKSKRTYYDKDDYARYEDDSDYSVYDER